MRNHPHLPKGITHSLLDGAHLDARRSQLACIHHAIGTRSRGGFLHKGFLVLDGGKLAEFGTPRALMSGRGKFHEMVGAAMEEGLGVFDPAINAFSILTEILPVPIHVTGAELRFPSNCETPIAADVSFAGPHGLTATADLDFLYEGDPFWTMAVETDGGMLTLTQGGAVLEVPGDRQGEGWGDQPGIHGEYPRLYSEMARLLAAGQSEVDTRPLTLVADAFMLGRRVDVAPFTAPTLKET